MLIYYGPCNILDSSRPATSGKAICIISTNLEATKTSHLQCIQTSKSKVQAIKINSSIQDFDLIFFFDSYCRCILDLLKQLFAKIVSSQMFKKVPNTTLWIVPVNTERNHIPKCHVTTQSC